MSQKSPSILATKQWLIDNPSESVAIATRLWNLPTSTLYTSIAREKNTTKERGGKNRVLTVA
jgi:hypothetical protein